MARLEGLSPYDLLIDKKTGYDDELLGIEGGFMPQTIVEDHWRQDHTLPGEMRKFVNQQDP